MENRELLGNIRQIMKEELQTLVPPIVEAGLKPLRADIQELKDQQKQINDRLDILEIKSDMTHEKLYNMDVNNKISERAIRKDIALLRDSQETIIAILEGHGMMPKMM